MSFGVVSKIATNTDIYAINVINKTTNNNLKEDKIKII